MIALILKKHVSIQIHFWILWFWNSKLKFIIWESDSWWNKKIYYKISQAFILSVPFSLSWNRIPFTLFRHRSKMVMMFTLGVFFQQIKFICFSTKLESQESTNRTVNQQSTFNGNVTFLRFPIIKNKKIISLIINYRLL